MIFAIYCTIFFICVFYSRKYLKYSTNKLSLRKKNIALVKTNENKMSDDEFCDPSAARKHWQKEKDNTLLQQSKIDVLNNKRLASFESSGINKNNVKKSKTLDLKKILKNGSEKYCNPIITSNDCHKKNIKTVSHPLQTSLFRWKNSVPPDIPDRNENNEKETKVIDVIELTDDESEVNVSSDGANSESSFKNIPDNNDLPSIGSDNSSLKNYKTDDNKSTLISKCLNKMKYFLRFVESCNDILPPGMPPVIAGVPVKFPITPYKSQISVMNAVIKGCKNEENCLLESPTGSGKTLALLCAALAWQTYFIKNSVEAIEASQNRNQGTFGDYWKGISNSRFGDSEDVTKENIPRIPKIFYGSRTHKQIAQVIREFKKTGYSEIPMTILSSREHSCIQPTWKGISKTQLCNELLDPLKERRCPFYGEKYKAIASHENLNYLGFETPWDIEDLVELGKENNACPYFAARDLLLEANIVFCPYNYLIDPAIREAMQIQIDGHVVIVDEAHNIEDICRNVGSYILREDHLGEAIEDLKLIYNFKNEYTYKSVYEYFTTLETLIMDQYISTPNNPHEEAMGSFWTGEETWILLGTYKLHGERYKEFVIDCRRVIEDYNTLKEDMKGDQNNKKRTQKPLAININTKKLIEDLVAALKCISLPQSQTSYRCCVSQAFHHDAKVKVSDNSWISAQGGNRIRKLKFMCMNSEMIFSEVSRKARCVILASGTLSPVMSFESELGTKFPHKLHANHVVTKNQVYVRAISHGPTGTTLRATYQNVQTLPFKDDLGRLIGEVCKCIPHGVLCFFSSYTSMRSIMERWQDTSMWEDLNQCKRVFVEPRQNSDLDEVMTEYREAAETGGALLLAVFRGKVAEGIDFSDNTARCVITIGIPFAVQNDPDVKLKREYNEINRSKGLLSGSEWYTIQAYRALNQALGRCIRHKHDWGAILLVDERLVPSNNYLPKWIREMRLEGSNYNLQQELVEFVRKQQ